MSRIKVLFTIPNFDTAGSGKVVYDLVKGLDKTKFEPEICCFHDKGDFFRVIKGLQIKIHLFRFTEDYRPLITFPYRLLKVYKFFKINRFDIIHSWHWSSDFSEPLAAKLAGIPYVYTKKAMGWGNKAWCYKSKLSTKIIVINSDMIQEFFLKMKEKTIKIPLGVDADYFKAQANDHISHKDVKLNSGNFVIISVANLVPIKGIEILLESVKMLKDSSIKVLIIGDCQNNYGRNLMSRYANEQFHFVGKKTDVRPYLAMANLFVIPTKNEGRKEGLPIAPIEAMASETIVLGSNIAGIKDILIEFPNCLFEAGNIVELSSKIKWIKNMNDDEKKELASLMRNFIVKEFSIERFLNEHEILYKSLSKS